MGLQAHPMPTDTVPLSMSKSWHVLGSYIRMEMADVRKSFLLPTWSHSQDVPTPVVSLLWHRDGGLCPTLRTEEEEDAEIYLESRE